MAVYAVTGSASGIGAATKARLEGQGHRVIGVDRVAAYVAGVHDDVVVGDVGRDEDQ